MPASLDLLRLATAGSVDDGMSTQTGALLDLTLVSSAPCYRPLAPRAVPVHIAGIAPAWVRGRVMHPRRWHR
jgi:hypothetical protein